MEKSFSFVKHFKLFLIISAILVVVGVVGLVTLPFGLNLFVASNITEKPVLTVAKGCIPFIVLSVIALLLITYIPQISLWLPMRVYGGW